MVFRYYFDPDPMNDSVELEYYEYDPEYSDMAEYIKRTHSNDEIIEDYIDAGLYSKLPDSDKEILNTFGGFDGTIDSIQKMSEEEKESLVDENLLIELILDTKVYYDELESYFEDDAFQTWSEQY